MQTITQPVSPELEEKIKELAKPGVIFNEPVQFGEYTLITASRFIVRRRMMSAAPFAVIYIGPKGVRIRYFRNPFFLGWMLAMLVGIVFWSAMILHPPWRENVNLLEEVKELIKTIRSRQTI
jgi:hypothetical protein